MAMTQIVLTCTLLGFLLTWMITFAVLAIRPQAGKKVSQEDLSIPSQPIPVVLHIIASQPLQSHVGTINPEPPGDIGATPIA